MSRFKLGDIVDTLDGFSNSSSSKDYGGAGYVKNLTCMSVNYVFSDGRGEYYYLDNHSLGIYGYALTKSIQHRDNKFGKLLD